MSSKWSLVAIGVIALVLLLSACAKPTPSPFGKFREGRTPRPRPDTGAPAAAPPLRFVLDTPLPEARLGEPYSYSFCLPRPQSDLLCGGLIPDPRISRPIGGVQPYTFQRDTLSEFLPTGLTLHPNGVLDGTPDPQRARPGPYNLTICAVDNLRSPSCARVELLVRPAAVVEPIIAWRITESPSELDVTVAYRYDGELGDQVDLRVRVLELRNLVLEAGVLRAAFPITSVRINIGTGIATLRLSANCANNFAQGAVSDQLDIYLIAAGARSPFFIKTIAYTKVWCKLPSPVTPPAPAPVPPVPAPRPPPPPAPAPTLETLTYKGTFTMTATTGDWRWVGWGDEKASATVTYSFDDITLKPVGSYYLRGTTRVPGPWSGEWGKRYNVQGCIERSGSVRGKGGDGVSIDGEFDRRKPDQVKIQVYSLHVGGGPETREGYPPQCPPFLTATGFLLGMSFNDCNEKNTCNTFKAAGGSLSFKAARAEIGSGQREILTSTGSYNGTAQLTLVSQPRR